MSTSYPVSYSTVSDVLETLPHIGSVTNITSGDIAYQMGRVEQMINARLSRVYTLPFSSVPLLLTTITTDLTIYELSKRFSILSGMKQNSPLSKYKESENLLDDIVKGYIPLLDSSLAIISKSTNSGLIPWSNMKSLTPTFDEDEMEYSVVDEDKLA